MYYLSTSKIAIAVLGNLAFAMALTLYNLTTKVGFCEKKCHACSVMLVSHRRGFYRFF